MTGGAYDVTVGPLVELWGFGQFLCRDNGVPPRRPIDDWRGAGSVRQRLALGRREPPAADATRQGCSIDLSSIAKGYAVDRVISDLLAGTRRLENTLVEIGGELRARGERPEGGRLAPRRGIAGPGDERRFSRCAQQ
jgi:thiamine biosynthesis lipoprotein